VLEQGFRETPQIDADCVPEHVHLLVIGVSWEDRFMLGLERLLDKRPVGSVLALRYIEWEHWTREATGAAQALCQARDIPFTVVSLSHQRPETTWRGMRALLEQAGKDGGSALVDITTMPREAIWSTFFFLESCGMGVAYAYHRPSRYDPEWLSRDPGRPRFAFQMSGEAQLGRDTVLLVTTGFDTSRTEQLMRTFEPALTLMALQEGDQFDNIGHNVEPHKHLEQDLGTMFHGRHQIRSFLVDAYSSDHGRSVLEAEAGPRISNSNVIMASLGPKLTSVALYQIHVSHPETALVYAPSGDYNHTYSMGIGETSYGIL
jgi:hypothetical protein